MNRREIIKHLAAVPFVGVALPDESLQASSLSANASSPTGMFSSEQNIYESIGVEPIINCRGTFTIIGGSIERPEVLEAMEAASGYFVQYDELAFGIGQRLADITGADWGMISSGCAAGLKHVTAACVAGGNPEKLIRIPDLTGLEKTEVIIPGYSRNVYDHAIRNIGVDIVTVDTPEELERALNAKTAMIYIMTGKGSDPGQPLSLEVIAKIAKPYNVPVLVDAAAENLTIPNVHLKQGATIVAYSGGKAICGPQCAGLLLGDKDLLMAAWQASSPHHGPGRDDKVGKEEMLGMLAAVEAWKTRDHDAEWDRWLTWLDEISKKVIKIKGVTTNVTQPRGLSNRAPVLHVNWNPSDLHITGEEVAEALARNKPRVAIGGRSRDDVTSVTISPNQMQDGEAKTVADRIYGVLSKKRKPKTDEMIKPKVDISGQWDVNVEFFHSASKHTFFIEQDGNWIQGSHKTDFSIQEMVGMVEGDEVKLRSNYRVPGNSISYWFAGKVANDTISGSIYMGEYLTAKFTAKRASYKSKRKRIVIPSGPPLAT